MIQKSHYKDTKYEFEAYTWFDNIRQDKDMQRAIITEILHDV